MMPRLYLVYDVPAQGAPVRIGWHCVIMESVTRGAGKHPCALGDYALVGPHAYISSATRHGRAFTATGVVVAIAEVAEIFG